MSFENIQTVHCVGIGGIGVSAVARFFLLHGAVVSGSDSVDSDEIKSLRESGITVSIGHSEKNISQDVDLVVYSPAIDEDNPERIYASSQGIIQRSYPEVLGDFLRSHIGIAVSGTNGKTSTTALLGKMLESGGKDPNVIVGGRVTGWDSNYRFGKGDLFVVEGCEYKRSMLNLFPHCIVLTNIEEDHLDYYKDLEDIKNAFREYVSHLTSDDVLVCNYDDMNIRDVIGDVMSRVITFGFGEGADVRAHEVKVVSGFQYFSVSVYGEDRGEFVTKMPGKFNIYNILAAMASALDVGVDINSIKTLLAEYPGSWRRFERVGSIGDIPVISDYAHHPTAVKDTIIAAKEMYGEARILVVFQPHQKDRTIKLFDSFVESFAGSDKLIIVEIYEVAGREDEKQKISSKDLVREVLERGGVDTAVYAKDFMNAEKLIREQLTDIDLVLIMGAGDIDVVARNLVEKTPNK